MAAGITQPAGNGGDILYEDNAHADASLDAVAGSYDFEDHYQKSQANGWKAVDGVTAAVEKWGGAVFGLIAQYWYHVSIQNGDGTGTATTTLKAKRCQVKFDAGKTMKVSATGIANRFTELGLLQETAPGDAQGYDGVELAFGATTTIDGNHKIYGSTLRVFGGLVQLNIRRTSTSAVGDMVDTTLESYGTNAAATVSVGTSTIPTERALHIWANVWGNASASVNLFNCLDADDLHYGGISNTRLNVTSAYTYVRDANFSGTPAAFDVRGSSGGNDFVDTIWSGAATQVNLNVTFNDWRTYSPVVIDEVTGSPVSGVDVEVKDGAVALILGTGSETGAIVSDSNGQISYTKAGLSNGGSIPIPNSLVPRRRAAGGSGWIENGPFTATYRKAGYSDRVVVFAWPRTTGVFGDQLLKVIDIVPMSLPVPPTPPVEVATETPHRSARFYWPPGGSPTRTRGR